MRHKCSSAPSYGVWACLVLLLLAAQQRTVCGSHLAQYRPTSSDRLREFQPPPSSDADAADVSALAADTRALGLNDDSDDADSNPDGASASDLPTRSLTASDAADSDARRRRQEALLLSPAALGLPAVLPQIGDAADFSDVADISDDGNLSEHAARRAKSHHHHQRSHSNALQRLRREYLSPATQTQYREDERLRDVDHHPGPRGHPHHHHHHQHRHHRTSAPNHSPPSDSGTDDGAKSFGADPDRRGSIAATADDVHTAAGAEPPLADATAAHAHRPQPERVQVGAYHRRHHMAKRSFFDIQCKGVYDKSIFAKLDRICEDCYNLFREPSLHSLCRKNCFTTDYFKGCVETLQLTDEIEEIQAWIKLIHGADPGLGD